LVAGCARRLKTNRDAVSKLLHDVRRPLSPRLFLIILLGVSEPSWICATIATAGAEPVLINRGAAMQVNEVVTSPCNHCGHPTNHLVVAVRHFEAWFEREELEGGAPPDVQYEYAMLECGGCQSISLRVDELLGGAVFSSNFYPPRVQRKKPAWSRELPIQLQSLISEIYAALANDSRKLAVMGARAALDVVLTQKVGRPGTFQSRLKALEARGFIGRANREILSAALEVRSAAAQRAYAPTSDIVNEIMDIIENLLHAVYIFPKSLKKIKRSTPRRAARKITKKTR
jgi:hypothetical protein